MTLEIRDPRPEELPEVALTISIAFDGEKSPEPLLHRVRLFDYGQPIAMFEEGRVVACLTIYPLAALYEGAEVRLAGVSTVSCLPEERRRGLVGRLLSYTLDRLRQEGFALSGLHTTHPSLYRRYGWAVAHRNVHYLFRPKEISPRWLERPQGKARRLTEEDWPLLDSLYRRRAPERNGSLVRPELWWRNMVLRTPYDPGRRLQEIAVWTGPTGEPTGYLLYEARMRRTERGTENLFTVRELVALDGDAYAGLLRYILSFDLARDIQVLADPADPLLTVVDEAQRVQVSLAPGMMLRLVDVPRALSGRPTRAREGVAFTLAVQDEAAPWNQGLWRIETEGRLHVRPAQGEPDLSCDAGHLAAIYSGLVTVKEAARLGLLRVHNPAALDAAEAALSASRPPGAPEYF